MNTTVQTGRSAFRWPTVLMYTTAVEASGALGLVAAGLGAGLANAAAGGGTLVAYPALIALGLPPVLANVTSTAGLLPGYAGSCVGYRRELGQQRRLALWLVSAGLVGGVLGALVFVITPGEVFAAVVPPLVLLACLLLALQPRIVRWVARPGSGRSPGLSIVLVVTLLCAGYGSFFGAGLGIVLLASLGSVLVVDMQSVNALKAAVSLFANAAGLLVFALVSTVAWTAAGLLAVGAFAGGQVGAAAARRLDAGMLRTIVLLAGLTVGLHLAVQTYA